MAERIYYPIEEEVQHLRNEVRSLRNEQEKRKHSDEPSEKSNEKTGEKSDEKADEKPDATNDKPDEKAKAERGKPEGEKDKPETESEHQSHLKRNIAIGVVLLIAAIVGFFWWLHSRDFESTDDAEIEGHISALTARVAGTITAVYAEENQTVKNGQALVDLDPNDLQAAAETARAQLSLAQAQTQAAQPNIPVTQETNRTNIATSGIDITKAEAGMAAAERNYAAALAKVQEAEATSAKAQADVARYQPLAAKDEVPRQEFDQVVANAKAMDASVSAAKASAQAAQKMVDQSRAEVDQARRRANEVQANAPSQLAIQRADVAAHVAAAQAAKAQLDQASLNLSYSKIKAPVDGIVAKRIAEIGQHVAPGQQVFLIAQTGDPWITANFRETQLLKMKPGQSVVIHVDALNKDFDGYVESMPGASGVITSLLPPENATGNFVKVVQRLPVRIGFKKNQDLNQLRPGMSVEPKVRVQ